MAQGKVVIEAELPSKAQAIQKPTKPTLEPKHKHHEAQPKAHT